MKYILAFLLVAALSCAVMTTSVGYSNVTIGAYSGYIGFYKGNSTVYINGSGGNSTINSSIISGISSQVAVLEQSKDDWMILVILGAIAVCGYILFNRKRGVEK